MGTRDVPYPFSFPPFILAMKSMLIIDGSEILVSLFEDALRNAACW